jgi:hypothetical protein
MHRPRNGYGFVILNHLFILPALWFGKKVLNTPMQSKQILLSVPEMSPYSGEKLKSKNSSTHTNKKQQQKYSLSSLPTTMTAVLTNI